MCAVPGGLMVPSSALGEAFKGATAPSADS